MNETEVNNVLEIITDEESHGSEAFEQSMKDAGACMAERFAENDDLNDKAFAIVTSAQDREFFALGFAETLVKHEARVTVSTLWSKFMPAKGFVTSMAVLLAQHHEQHPEQVDYLAYVCSSLDEDANVAEGLSRMSKVTEAKNFLVFALTGSSSELENLDQQLYLRDTPQPRIYLLEGERSLDRTPRGASVRKGLRDHLTKAYGRKGLGYIPQSLGGPKPQYQSVYSPAGPGW